MKRTAAALLVLTLSATAAVAMDNRSITSEHPGSGEFTLIKDSTPTPVLVSGSDLPGIRIAAGNLAADFERVCGSRPRECGTPDSPEVIVIGSLDSPWISRIAENGGIDAGELRGKTEKYLISTVINPFEGVEKALVITGSDMRGTIYGIYELSEQIGVSPWYDWMDVPAVRHTDLYLADGSYTAGEPAVRYRGIFLNDEAPCLTSWVKNTYGTDYGGHDFYARVFELILRLRGNFMWPAMWGWAFYADDPLNSVTANEMGVIIGTSHHEPMARNHQEWVRHRDEYGEWDYVTNRKILDKFFTEGMRRALGTEDLITIGMRGDGDTAMGAREGHDDEFTPDDIATIKLLEKIVDNQRRIIRKETGRPAEERPQVWALYKEVQRYYDKGMKVPDDAIILLSDDNWGDIRRLPSAEELRNHKGGFGMYYHVDYVGAPRNSKWLNVTPIQHMWDQLHLTASYGVDRLWVLNVGDLKPMEYPIDLFFDMAWNPESCSAADILDHTRGFCAQQFGEEQSVEAARILNLYSKYAGRVTPEMLDCRTYDLESGEWSRVVAEWTELEACALRQFVSLDEKYRDAYTELILFPVQAFGNLYRMYYAQAQNLAACEAGLPEADGYADEVERCFNRDAELCRAYNEKLAGGKWNGMMTQKHIGYFSWNDNFPADRLPRTSRIGNAGTGGYVFTGRDGCIVMEAPHFYSCRSTEGTEWTVIPDMGRTMGGVALMPYTASAEGSALSYRMELPEDIVSAEVHVIVNSTLAFSRAAGHRYRIGFEGAADKEVNFNGRLNEEPENIYSIYYPTVAGRVIESTVTLEVPAGPGPKTLVLSPVEPGTVFEKIVVDWGGYRPGYLFGEESPKAVK